jgi:hypothetical protein
MIGECILASPSLLSFAADGALADQLRAILAACFQPHVTQGRREDLPSDRQNLRCRDDRVVEAAGDAGECGQKEIAERVAAQGRVI